MRAFFTPMLAYLAERLDGIKAALRAGSLCMITSLQSGLFGLKSLFAMVTDPAVSFGLSDEQLRLALEHLPWTRLVADDRSTDDQGETVDLLAYLAARREQLVIKPTDGYGGARVELGWLHNDDSWAKVIANAAAGGHVAQQRVPIVTEHFSLLREGFPLQGLHRRPQPAVVLRETVRLLRAARAGGRRADERDRGRRDGGADVHPGVNAAVTSAAQPLDLGTGVGEECGRWSCAGRRCPTHVPFSNGCA